MAKAPAPATELFWDATEICQVEGFWYYPHCIETITAFRTQFKPRPDDDVLLTSFPKSGATWLIALSLNILNRDEDDDVLTKKGPHEVVPTLDFHFLKDQIRDMLLNPPPEGCTRLFHSHLPYSYLPEAAIGKEKERAGCKIVHVARNPKDAVASMWPFYNKAFGREVPVEVAVESFCTGVSPFAPFYEHVLEYWEESRRRPEEVLFLKYEDLRKEPVAQVRRLASFLGKPFPPGGEGDGEVEKVVWRSSLERLKELEVNKNGVGEITTTENKNFFRKGAVGDWKNHLTPEMARRIDRLTEVKLQGTGLSFDDE